MGSTHVVQALSFSMFLSILIVDFDLILGSFLTFWALKGYFRGLGKGSKNVMGSTQLVEQLSFCMFPSFLIFDFCLILGPFFHFLGP